MTTSHSSAQAMARCQYCRAKIPECDVETHEDECRKRCPHCFKLVPAKTMHSHVEGCELVLCTNEWCEAKVRRRDLEEHLEGCFASTEHLEHSERSIISPRAQRARLWPTTRRISALRPSLDVLELPPKPPALAEQSHDLSAWDLWEDPLSPASLQHDFNMTPLQHATSLQVSLRPPMIRPASAPAPHTMPSPPESPLVWSPTIHEACDGACLRKCGMALRASSRWRKKVSAKSMRRTVSRLHEHKRDYSGEETDTFGKPWGLE